MGRYARAQGGKEGGPGACEAAGGARDGTKGARWKRGGAQGVRGGWGRILTMLIKPRLRFRVLVIEARVLVIGV